MPFTDTAWLDQSTDTQGGKLEHKKWKVTTTTWMYQRYFLIFSPYSFSIIFMTVILQILSTLKVLINLKLLFITVAVFTVDPLAVIYCILFLLLFKLTLHSNPSTVKLSSLCVSLFGQASCCFAVFSHHSYLHIRNTTHLWFLYECFTFSSVVPQSWHRLSWVNLFAMVFCDYQCEMPQKQRYCIKKSPKVFSFCSTKIFWMSFCCLAVLYSLCSL